jgi:hypothetical protein
MRIGSLIPAGWEPPHLGAPPSRRRRGGVLASAGRMSGKTNIIVNQRPGGVVVEKVGSAPLGLSSLY